MDPNKLLEDAELALTDKEARQRLIDSMKDACLEFLLQYLPSMPIPPIDGEKVGRVLRTNVGKFSTFLACEREPMSQSMSSNREFNPWVL